MATTQTRDNRALATRPGSVQMPDPDNLMQLVVGSKDIAVDIPMTATLNDVEETLGIAIRGYRNLISAAEALKPIIGRILLTVRERKLYTPGYKNFTQFVARKVVEDLGFGRSNAFDALRIARAFPTLNTAEYMHYGASRLLLAASAGVTTADTNWKTFLESSREVPVEQFKDQVTEIRKGKTLDRPRPFIVAVRVTAEVQARWNNLRGETPAATFFETLLETFEASLKMPTRAAGRATSHVRRSAGGA